jgi:hypothetical protein
VRARDKDGAARSVELGLELESGSGAGKGTTPTGGVPLTATAREREREREGSARGWARETLRPRKKREKRGAGLRGSWTEAWPTREGKEGERRGSPREKREWAGVAHAEGRRGKKELGRARGRFGLPSFIPSPFLSFSIP